MNKTLKIALREYNESVRTKAFIFTILFAPIFMSGGILAMMLLRGQVDTTDKRIAVVDRSGVVAQAIVDAAKTRNMTEVYEKETGKKIKPAYNIEVVEPSDEAAEQRLELSNRVRAKTLYAFIEIGENVVFPRDDSKSAAITYYSESSRFSEIPGWLARPVNEQIRKLRAAKAGLDTSLIDSITRWTPVESLSLVTVNKATGTIREAERSNDLLSIGIPLILVMLLFLMIMMGAMPLLNSALEEKAQRISEVLLGSVRPFQLMLGKLIGNLGVSFTAGAVYMIGGAMVGFYMGIGDFIPYHLIPWFLVYTILAISMNGAMFSAIGSACNDAKETQSLMLPFMLPLMIPIFVLVPILREPNSAFATWMSLFPPFTPQLMLLRQSIPGGVPFWQPLVGLIGVLAFTMLYVWAAGRIFRVGLLMQGKPPKLGNLVKWVFRG